ncbi:hypothetical protein BJ742DRAFT_805832 [Cladochytrium replicatum]|nr:hypothetical protein BJ742DRAFT_805832 [Cladochytrium replicatum]
MSTHAERVDILRSSWEFAAFCQFLHLFRHKFQLDDFDTDAFESQLAAAEIDPQIVNLHVRLLRMVSSNRSINNTNWTFYVRREAVKRSAVDDKGGFLWPEDVEYSDLDIRSKILILHYLSEWQWAHPERLRETKEDENEVVHWRVEPIGHDSKRNSYWLFDDNRLYKASGDILSEAPPNNPPTKRGNKAKSRRRTVDDFTEPSWSLVARTSDDWQIFPQQFQNSRNAQERQLYTFLVDQVLPKVLDDIQEKEKERMLQEMVNNRKRSSRLMKDLTAMEDPQATGVHYNTRYSARRVASDPPRKPETVEEKKKRVEDERRRRLEERGKKFRERDDRDFDSAILEFAEVSADMDTPPPNTRRSATKQRKSNGDYGAEEVWYFDCICGVNGYNIDDHSVLIECERCNVWQHMSCVEHASGLGVNEDGSTSTPFLCQRCNAKVSATSKLYKSPTFEPSKRILPVMIDGELPDTKRLRISHESESVHQVSVHEETLIDHPPTETGFSTRNGLTDSESRAEFLPKREGNTNGVESHDEIGSPAPGISSQWTQHNQNSALRVISTPIPTLHVQ